MITHAGIGIATVTLAKLRSPASLSQATLPSEPMRRGLVPWRMTAADYLAALAAADDQGAVLPWDP